MYHQIETQMHLPWQGMSDWNSAEQWVKGTYIIGELLVAFRFQNQIGHCPYMPESVPCLRSAQLETEWKLRSNLFHHEE